MNGVEILSVIENPIYQFNGTAFSIGFFTIFAILLICGVFIMAKEDDYILGATSIILGIFFGVTFGILLGITFETETGEVDTIYKVTVSEEVSLNEFMEKYEIIDQEDKIYTIRERE